MTGTRPRVPIRGGSATRDEPCTCSRSRSRCSSSCSCTSTTWCASCSSSRSARPMPGRPTASTASRCTPSTRSLAPATTSTCRRGRASMPASRSPTSWSTCARARWPHRRALIPLVEAFDEASRGGDLLAAPCTPGGSGAPRVDRRRDRGAARRRRGTEALHERGRRLNVLYITVDQWRGDCLSRARSPGGADPEPRRAARRRACGSPTTGPTPRPAGRAGRRSTPACTCRTTGRCSTAPRSTTASPTSPSRRGRPGYDPTLFGYTDTSVDPRTVRRRRSPPAHLRGRAARLRRAVLLDPADDAGARGRRWLAEPRASTSPPTRARPLRARPPATPAPTSTARRWAPTRFAAEHTETAFLDRARCIELARPARRRRAVVRPRQLTSARTRRTATRSATTTATTGRATVPASGATPTATPRSPCTRWRDGIAAAGRRLPDRRARDRASCAPPTTG